MARPDWDNYFLKIAEVVASRSTCLRRQVGAVLVRDKRILTTGYNGAPSGLPHCAKTGCMRKKLKIPSGQHHELCRGLHAEMNAVIQAAIHGVSVAGSTLYCTVLPCSLCAKLLVNVGVKRIVTAGNYPDKLSEEIISQSNIEVVKINNPPRCIYKKHKK
ncbi:MAG: cytidine/deoxycytidylate deaminase family protein [Planctomycetota bacterium]